MIKLLPTKTVFYLFILIGTILRFLQFGNIPTGFHGDEASIGFEAFSLLNTGADRWGHKLPAYFLSWGSGQNTLYGYLTVPFVSFFGLSEFSVRILAGVTGILCIPMAYKIIMLLFANKNMARLAAILYLFDPFLFMTSRWGDEFNIVPFFVLLLLLLLILSIKLSIEKKELHFWDKATILALFPSMALLFYAYAPSLFIVPLFLFLVLFFYWKSILANIRFFGFSVLLGVLIIAPFALFILKNNILKHNLSFESSLPFSLPIMLSPRERIFIGFAENLAIIKQNMFFVFSGFIDLYVWTYNTTNFRVSHYFLLFIIPAIIYLTSIFKNNKNDPRNILLLWLVASFSIFFLYHVNLNRSLHFQTIVPLIVAIGLVVIYEKLKDNIFKKIAITAASLFFIFQATSFFGEYFIKFPNYSLFPKDVKWAIEIANKNKLTDEKVAFSKELIFNYLYAAFHTKHDPTDFQKNVKTDLTTGNVIVHSFGNFRFLGDVVNTAKPNNINIITELKKEQSFVAILHANEVETHFNDFREVVIQKDENHEWRVVRFSKK
jgi:4-amino-4-deoxy-L-arabinose transferase-like glycosyltransferase